MRHSRRFLILAAAVLVSALSVTSALAANVHFKKPAPTFTDQGTTLSSTGTLTGLGNGDIKVTITATGVPSTTCTNQGGNQSPGQNPASGTYSGTLFIPQSKVQNGNVGFTVATKPPSQPTAADAGCPNSNWTAQITDVAFSSATINVYQDTNGQNGIFDEPGTLVLTQTFQL